MFWNFLFLLIFLVLIYIIKRIENNFKWKRYEKYNVLGANRKNAFIDKKGYLRWKSKRLVHRDTAYRFIFKKNRQKYRMPFSKYQIHHKNRRKWDNRIDNLQILTKSEHERMHGWKFKD